MNIYDFANFVIDGDIINFKKGCIDSNFLVRHKLLSFDIFKLLIEHDQVEMFIYFIENVKFENDKLIKIYLSINNKEINPIIMKIISEKLEKENNMINFITECKIRSINYKDYFRF